MENLTEDALPFEPIVDRRGNSLLLSTPDGDYVLFPDVDKFVTDNNGEALMLDENGHVHVLRKGLKKNTLTWVRLTTDEGDK